MLSWFGVVLIIFIPFALSSILLENDIVRKWFIHGKGGSARWGGYLCFLKHNRLFCRKAPIYLGKTLHKYDPWIFTQNIGLDDENHLITVAMSRSGKSTDVIWPNLVKYAYPDSIFVIDPKGEHAIMTGNARAKKGHQVYVLDPFNHTKGKITTHSFNPLAEIDINSGRAKEDIGEISDACIISFGKADETSNHFKELQRSIISGLIAHVMSTKPKEKHNLPAIYDYFMEMGKGQGGFENLIKDMRDNNACGNCPQEAALAYENAGVNERGSIFTSTLASLKWIASDAMRKHLRRSDFSLSELKTKRTSLYIVLDFDAMLPEKQGRYMRTIINLALYKAHITPMPAVRKSKGRRVLFILDEVAQLGYMSNIERAYKTYAGSDMKLWCFFQNQGSFEDTYSSYKDMMGNSSKQFFGCGAMETAEVIEDYLGKYLDKREGEKESQKSLLDATEIMDTLGKNKNLQIVITSNNDKMELRRIKHIPNPNIKFKEKEHIPNSTIESEEKENIQNNDSKLVLDESNLISQANKGNMKAQYALGFKLYDNVGTSEDYKEAVKWFTKAAEQGHMTAPHYLKLIAKKNKKKKPKKIKEHTKLEPTPKFEEKENITPELSKFDIKKVLKRWILSEEFTEDQVKERYSLLFDNAEDNEQDRITEEYNILIEKFDIKAVRKHWILPKDFTKEQVKERYPLMLDNAEDSELDQVTEEYNILMNTNGSVKKETRNITLPNGSIQPFTAFLEFWNGLEHLIQHCGYTEEKLVELAMINGKEMRISFEQSFSNSIDYIYKKHTEK